MKISGNESYMQILNEAFGLELQSTVFILFFRKYQWLYNVSLVQINMILVFLTLLLLENFYTELCVITFYTRYPDRSKSHRQF